MYISQGIKFKNSEINSFINEYIPYSQPTLVGIASNMSKVDSKYNPISSKYSLILLIFGRLSLRALSSASSLLINPSLICQLLKKSFSVNPFFKKYM